MALRKRPSTVGGEHISVRAGDHEGGTRVRFWQHYATELDDDSYGIYNFNWGYYLESLRLFCETGTGKPFNAAAG